MKLIHQGFEYHITKDGNAVFPEQKKTIVELEQTINKLQSKLTNTTNELHEERLEVDKLRKICNNLFDVDGNGLLGDVSDE